MKRNFICNLFIAVLFCCGFTANAQSLRDEGVSAKLAPWKTPFKAASVGYVYGDVNGDDKTDISDVVTIINLMSQNDKSNPRADVNEDEEINISDVVKVINIMAGLDTPPITVDKSYLDMTTGESEDVRIVRVSGSGEYEVTNENPEIVMVEWLSDSSTASERRKVKGAGETEVGEGNSFSTDGFLKVYALQPGQAKITVVDKNTSRKLIVSITVTADYNTEIFADISPIHEANVIGSTVACKFSVNPPWTGLLDCRIILSDQPDMSGTIQIADITINGTEGEKIVYNETGETTTFANLNPDTKYYWRITYFDEQSNSYLNGSPIFYFFMIEDPAVAAGLCPDENHPHVIDMGNPVKWSCCNVGASAPWEFGGYYAWGETEEKDCYDWSNYKHCDGSENTCHDLGNDIAGTDYDVSHVKWGDRWRMPDSEHFRSLLKYNYEEISLNGVLGMKLSGSNGAALFLPYSGCRIDLNKKYVGSNAGYWSSTNSPNRFIIGNDCLRGVWDEERRIGYPVRPVIFEDPAVYYGLCPDENHPHVIDMGEAGKWSCCNVGASAPWEYGGYYAWGETEEKEDYRWDNYKHCDGTENSCHDLGGDIAGTKYDVVHLKWGGNWCMPNYNQQMLLLNNCTNELIYINGIYGIKFTCSNSNSIFVPAAGIWWDGFPVLGSYGGFWSSTQDSDSPNFAFSFFFSNNTSIWSRQGRYEGQSVRPVFVDSEPEDPEPEAPTNLCPDGNHPHVIDMGEAGKWSCCNVGANAPWEYGGYYAWGETEVKDYYGWNTYKHSDGSEDTCHDLGDDIAGTKYDVAYVKWGRNWRMPKLDQMELLRSTCTVESTNYNGINGIKCTASSGNSIFLPATGYQWHEYTGVGGNVHYYWTATSAENNSRAYALFFGKREVLFIISDHQNRDGGFSVRPVFSEELIQEDDEDAIIYCVESAVGSYYESCQVKVNLDSILNVIGASSDNPDSYRVLAEYPDGSRGESVKGDTDGWRDALGYPKNWNWNPNDAPDFYLQDSEKADIFFMGGFPGKTDEEKEYQGTVVFINNVTNAEQKVIFKIKYVTIDPAMAARLCPDTQHPHVIDMGVAGKWSCYNVGASTPWEYGGYYALADK